MASAYSVVRMQHSVYPVESLNEGIRGCKIVFYCRSAARVLPKGIGDVGYNGDKWQFVELILMDVEGVAEMAAEAIVVCWKLLAVELTEKTFFNSEMKSRRYSAIMRRSIAPCILRRVKCC